MRFPTLKAVGCMALIVVTAACRKEPDVIRTAGSCDLLSSEEMAEVKAKVTKVTEASESLAAWRAWWSVNGTIPFSYAATQSAQYEWNGDAWDVTNATGGAFVTFSFQFPDGSNIFRMSDGQFETVTTLTLADGRRAGVEETYVNGDDELTNFYFEDWHEAISEENGEVQTPGHSSKAPFGTRWLIRATHEAVEQGEVDLKLPELDLTYSFESDGATARHEVMLNGEVRSYKGPAARCDGFAAKAETLYPSVFELFEVSRLTGGNP